MRLNMSGAIRWVTVVIDDARSSAEVDHHAPLHDSRVASHVGFDGRGRRRDTAGLLIPDRRARHRRKLAIERVLKTKHPRWRIAHRIGVIVYAHCPTALPITTCWNHDYVHPALEGLAASKEKGGLNTGYAGLDALCQDQILERRYRQRKQDRRNDDADQHFDQREPGVAGEEPHG